ncbi:MAG: hypothetical protein AAGK00_17075 [Pseudomonadota bacterium]
MDAYREKLYREAEVKRRECEEWIIARIIPDKSKWATKAGIRIAAMQELGCSKTAFDMAWIAAIERTSRRDWYNPLRKRGNSN